MHASDGQDPRPRRRRPHAGAPLAADPEIDVVGEAADGRAAVDLTRRLDPAVVVMDVELPALNGIDATREISTAAGGARVLILSMHAGDVYVREALNAGAKGYLLKEAADADLVAGVKAVARGASYFSPSVRALLVAGCLQGSADDPAQDGLWQLTPREREIVQLIAEGRTKRQIARMLVVHPETVESHRKRVMRKLRLHSVAEIVRFAMLTGLVR